MSPLDVLQRYFVGQLTGRYERPRYRIELDPFNPFHECNTIKASASFSPTERDRITEHFTILNNLGGQMICFGDRRYPRQLSHVPDPPWALNVLGNPVWLQHDDAVAVVGSRKSSRHALQNSYDLGRWLINRRSVVISGGAYGCDIAAHYGALAGGIAPTSAVVVLAGGVDHWYPSSHCEVFEDILSQGGTILSERLCGHAPQFYDFPIRNRIIAGMASSIYVMAAGKKSGAMITARKGLDYGRDIFVLLPNEADVRSDGIKDLLFDGALGFDGVSTLEENSLFYM